MLLCGAIALASSRAAGAQRDTTKTMVGMEMNGAMTMMVPDPLGITMERMGSGTTWIPDAAPIPSLYVAAPGHWDITGHGFLFGQYDAQSGPRGGRQLGSLNWLMLMASHALGGGRFQARTMLSLDAVGVTTQGYPLLLQSGEAYDGERLHDRQHPHDLWMELSALYERPVTKSVGIMLYAAPSGEPALGPVAFMHRPSAADNPVVPISHHWQDATHIAFGVLSAGLFSHTFKVEASLFNGREPDQHRFNFDPIVLDSYSGRATWNPAAEWSFTAGYGYMKSPEAMNPNESLKRMTASSLYGAKLGREGQLAAAVVVGANKHATEADYSRSVLLEGEAILDAKNTLFGRAEQVEKDAIDLAIFTSSSAPAPEAHWNVRAVSLGYIREVARVGRGTIGIGASATLNLLPSSLRATYGSRTPMGTVIFLRLRPFRSAPMMHDMEHATKGVQ